MSRSTLSTRKKVVFALITTALLLGLANGAIVLFERVNYGVSAEEKEILEKNPRSDEQPVSVVKDFPKEREELRKKLFHWVNATPDVTEETDKHLPPEITEMLRKAGYLDDIQ